MVIPSADYSCQGFGLGFLVAGVVASALTYACVHLRETMRGNQMINFVPYVALAVGLSPQAERHGTRRIALAVVLFMNTRYFALIYDRRV